MINIPPLLVKFLLAQNVKRRQFASTPPCVWTLLFAVAAEPNMKVV